ncbi:MAG: type II toxin-antitoxin system RelE/ParE family toxin [Nitrospinae bacterium]|nr:type II toxin-antitoxin system RelE/ParE family toxin [Nitrospinota bacterium]
MSQLRYLAQARDDLIHIKRYIARESGSQSTAIQYTEKIREQCRKLADLPGKMGRLRPELGENLRSFPYGNYVIFFMYNDDCLEIVTIIEGHRDIEAMFEE